MNIEGQFYSDKHAHYFANARLDVLPLLPEHIDKVLEIGAANGATLAHIKGQWPSARTVAVEPFPVAAAKARGCVDVVLEDTLENLSAADFADAPFDVILCLDVLEHMVDPWAAVAKLTGLLVPGGRIVASITNVSHSSSLFPLLFKNQWKLTDHGVLDRTHLRFFVKDSAVELMTSSGLKLHDVRPIFQDQGGPRDRLNKLTFGMFERFVAQQYSVTVVRER